MSTTSHLNKTSNRSRPIGPSLKKGFLFLAGLVILGFGSLSVLGKNGIFDLIRLQTLQKSLQSETRGLIEQQEELKAEVARLNDPRYIEYLARERLGLMRPNEVFLILDPPSPHSSVDN